MPLMTPSDPRTQLAELRANPVRQEDFKAYGMTRVFCGGCVRYQVLWVPGLWKNPQEAGEGVRLVPPAQHRQGGFVSYGGGAV